MLSLQFCGPPTHRAAATATFFSQTLIKPMKYQHFWLPNQAFAIKTNAKPSLLLKNGFQKKFVYQKMNFRISP